LQTTQKRANANNSPVARIRLLMANITSPQTLP
jgi:hypothetical protein